jgi:RNA polymerase sigma-70 factor, ECF subfamily
MNREAEDAMRSISKSPVSNVPLVPRAATVRGAREPVVANDTEGVRRGLVALVPDLRARAFHLAGERAVADDLVQDTVERALRFEAQYIRGTNLRAWVYQVLFSVFVTRYRRKRRERNALRDLGSDPCAWTVPEAFDGEAAALALTPSTTRELDALPPGFRCAVVMVDIVELTYREAASELGVPVGTVMSRLHRGRKLLAGKLRDAA